MYISQFFGTIICHLPGEVVGAEVVTAGLVVVGVATVGVSSISVTGGAYKNANIITT